VREIEREVGNNAWLGRREREKEKRTIGVVLSLHPGIVNSLVVLEDRYSWRKSSNVRVLSLMAVLVVVAIEKLQQRRETLSSLFLANIKLLLLKDHVTTQTNKRTPRA
jgi:hypothetical protein